MKSTVPHAFAFVAGVSLVWLVAAAGHAAAQPQPEPQPQPTDAGAEVKARGADFVRAFNANNVEQMWDLISTESRRLMENHLAEIKKVLNVRAGDKLDERINELNATARDVLALKDGKAYLAFLMERVTADERNKAVNTQLTDVKFSGETAALTWTGPAAASMPEKAVREDGKWRFVIATE